MIHRALKLLRNYHNIKQKDLAKALNLSPSHLSEIESGEKPVSYELLERYGRVLKMPVSTITLFSEMEALPAKSRSAAVQTTIADKALKLLEWLETVSQIHAHNESKQKAK